ncbi:MAG: hypothetical protein EOS63_03565 [Mesorhizobium sp.]|uniref:hypothetical protein n=1 Tax=Mesorhizobium sp. TaxID=1871066 RepID=UPI000FE8B4B9|nr:hypothetical protein [Mesorhizobium sp.]RWE84211.1 MAG: hypothetical protein EOS63_03565 [Mesorhizobium sp.]TIU62823.1 MAG: hypothetical protein E5W30_05690 [Mesorhizobium sp.]TJW64621.1 MAG: hypothetical protein E5V97_06390 [Mesorhizobium sp.]
MGFEDPVSFEPFAVPGLFLPVVGRLGWTKISRCECMSSPLSNQLRLADTSMLQEILREAEAYLGAQLTSAIAADQRAYTFSGTVGAVSILLVGASYTLATLAVPNSLLSLTSLLAAGALFVAAWMAVMSASSIDFEFSGNQPGHWGDDIERGIEMRDALAEQCDHYESMITANTAAMAKNASLFNSAVNIALAAIGIGGLLFSYWLARHLFP